MDLYALMVVRTNSCKTRLERFKFDDIFRNFYGKDSSLEIRITFDILGDKEILPISVLNILYAQMFTPQISEAEAEEEDIYELCSVAACILAKKFRCSPLFRERMNWQSHVNHLLKEGSFRSFYRMQYESFCELVRLLSPSLMVSVKQGRNRNQGGDHVYVELIVHVMLRYLAGGSYHDIRVTAGLAKSTFFSCLHRGVKAVNNCKELALKFPTLASELKESAMNFAAKSHGGSLDGCIAALDGWLCRIQVPPAAETMNKASYFSGHYQCHGLNVQAACDAACRFIFLSIRCPGGTGDSKAFYGTRLATFLAEISPGYYVVADNAYTLSATLLIPYSGNDKRYPAKDVFNFYLSQLRIKIEQAFGMMVNKWRVFKKPSELKLSFIPSVVECAMRLHNFCIDRRETDWKVHDLTPDLIVEHVPLYEEYLDEVDPADPAVPRQPVSQSGRRNNVREAITRQLAANGLSRPDYNKKRNSLQITDK